MKIILDLIKSLNTLLRLCFVKAAGVRARKSIGEIKKLASQYRTACLTESKEI